MRAPLRQIPRQGNANEFLQVLALVLAQLEDYKVRDDVCGWMSVLVNGEVVLGEVEEVGCVADCEGDDNVIVFGGGHGDASVDCLVFILIRN